MAAWYVVVVGRRVGVFDTWLEAAALVDNLSQARHVKFKSRDTAYAAFRAAEARGEVKIVDANPSISRGVQNPVVPDNSPPLNSSPSQVRVPPTNLDLPNESRPNEPRQCHTLTASPKRESFTLVGGEQTTFEQHPEMAEMSRTSNEEQLPEQSESGTAGPHQCSSKVARNFCTVGVQTVECHVPPAERESASHEDRDFDRGRPRYFRIQRNVDSDVSEPESLVSVEIIDNKRVSGKSKIPAVPPSQTSSGTRTAGLGANRRHRVIEPVPRHYTSSLAFQVHSRSSTTASSSRHAFVSTESDANGYPSGTDSSGPEDVTPRRSQTSRRDKGKGKQPPLVLISSDNESSDNDYDTASEIATPSRSRKSVKNSEVLSLKSRETPSRQDSSAKGSHMTGNHPYPQRCLTENRTPPHSFMLEALGLSQPAHVPSQVYEPGSDPRSPIRRIALVPELDSSFTFGRPSPQPARPLILSVSKLSKT